tara:strand:- start:446 stop:1033 length:588 start_codon:yes stop_codon:yes gene_type:complete
MGKQNNLLKLIRKNLSRSERNFRKFNQLKYIQVIVAASNMIIESLKNGNKIMFCGNGGSAADSQHLAAEMVGKFLKERDPLSALALTTNTSTLTSISNDISFKEVFSRQVKAFGKKGDILLAITTSGKSLNIKAAQNEAKKIGIKTILLTSTKALQTSNNADLIIAVPETRVDRIQEMHIAIGHIICEIVEESFS